MKKLTYDYVKNFIESEGYTLISDSYKNSRTKILIQCPEKHKYKVNYGDFKQGVRCPICYGKQNLTYDYVKNYIENNGYELLSNEYVNNLTVLNVKCSNGHKYSVSFGRFQQGCRCPICYGQSVSKRQNLTYDYVKNYIENNGYELLSNEYFDAHTKLNVKCPDKHVWSVRWNDFQQGVRCPDCSNRVSCGEREVAQFVKSLGINIVENDRTQIINPLSGHNLELDIWIPSMKKAIEYNGIYWHSFPDRQKLDKIKKDQCKKLGIDLLIVHDTKWMDNLEIEQQIIIRFIKGEI